MKENVRKFCGKVCCGAAVAAPGWLGSLAAADWGENEKLFHPPPLQAHIFRCENVGTKRNIINNGNLIKWQCLCYSIEKYNFCMIKFCSHSFAYLISIYIPRNFKFPGNKQAERFKMNVFRMLSGESLSEGSSEIAVSDAIDQWNDWRQTSFLPPLLDNSFLWPDSFSVPIPPTDTDNIIRIMNIIDVSPLFSSDFIMSYYSFLQFWI